MNVEVEFIQINEAICQLESKLTHRKMTGNILKNQGFFELALYYKNRDENLVLVDEFTRLEVYTSIMEAHPEQNFANRTFNFRHPVSIYSVFYLSLTSCLLEDLPYYWRADEFYDKLGNKKDRRKTVIYYKNQITSNELNDLNAQLEQANARIKELERQVNGH